MMNCDNYQSGRSFLPMGWGRPSAPRCSLNCRDLTGNLDELNVPAGYPTFNTNNKCNGVNRAFFPKSVYNYETYQPRELNNAIPVTMHLKLSPEQSPNYNGQAYSPQNYQDMSSSNGCDFDTGLANCSNNLAKVQRCPIGNRAEFTKPIIPRQNAFAVSAQSMWNTTYNKDFVPRKAEKRALAGPPKTPWRTAFQFEKDSVYRSAYQPPPPQKRELVKSSQSEYTPNTALMNARSTYTRDYYVKIGDRVQLARPKAVWSPSNVPLDDSTSYRVAFVPHGPICPPEKKTEEELRLEFGTHCAPFEGNTTYRRDYTPTGKPCQTPSLKPNRPGLGTRGKFDDRTIYRCAYEPFYYDCGQYENCVPAEPEVPKDKCDALTVCYPEVQRNVERELPVPPCSYSDEPSSCLSFKERYCQPRTVPCVSPYKMTSGIDDQNRHVITLENNESGDMKAGYPAIINCPMNPLRCEAIKEAKY